MDESKSIEFLKHQSKQDFDILKKWTNTSKMTELEAMDNLKTLIAGHIQKMLDHNFAKLMEILYQTDVNEKLVKQTFSSDKSSSEVATEIAQLYIDRMILKWQTRQSFATDDKGDWD